MCPRATCFQDPHPVLHLQGTEGRGPAGIVLWIQMPPMPTARDVTGRQSGNEPQAYQGQLISRILKRAKSQALQQLEKPLGHKLRNAKGNPGSVLSGRMSPGA